MFESSGNSQDLAKTLIHQSPGRNILVVTNNGSRTDDASSLISRGENKFKGWQCYVGIQGIHIYNNGDVYGSVCRMKYLGNVYSGFDIISIPIECQRNSCNCTTDVKIKKHIIMQ